ncbi:hypothetical protein WME76_33565 [Sorangium sp. So ce119]|uniref:hypothetical protein n=1 Tax=Sorangium sp. So ce119 TaxID=3133279 RepID=UPI003F63CBB0
MRYADTEACQSGGHCRRCRDPEKGRGFRLAVLRDFEVPGGTAEFECPHGIPWDTDVEVSRFARAIERGRATAHGALSALRTSLGVGLLPRRAVEARLDVCRRCPGGLVVMRGDDVSTCGKLLEVHREQGRSTCGCVLRLKAADAEEDCPNGWWPRDG